MATAGELKVRITGELSGLRRAMKKAKREVSRFGRRLNYVSSAAAAATVSATGLATAAAGVSVAVSAASAAAASGFAAIGIAAAATKEDVQAAFKGLGHEIKTTFQGISGPIDRALLGVASIASGTLSRLEGDFAEAFGVVAPYVEGAAVALSRFAQTAMPAAVSVTREAAPVVRAFGRGIEELGSGLAGFFAGLESGMGGAAATTRAFFGSLSTLVSRMGESFGRIAAASETIGPAFFETFTELTTVTLAFLEDAIIPLAPYITATIEGFTGFMRAVRESAGGVAAFTATVAPMLGLLASMGVAVSPVVAGAVALAGAAVTLHNNWDRVIGFFQSRFPQAFGVAHGAVRALWEGARQYLGALASVGSSLLAEFGETVRVWAQGISEVWAMWGDEIMNVTRHAFGVTYTFITVALRNAGDVISAFLNALTGDFAEAWGSVGRAMRRTFGPAINFVIRAAADGVRAMARLAQESLAKFGVLASVLAKLPGAVGQTATLVSAGVEAAFNGIGDLGAAAIEGMQLAPVDMRQRGGEAGSSFLSGLKSALSGAGNMLGGAFGGGAAGVPRGGVPRAPGEGEGASGGRHMILTWEKLDLAEPLKMEAEKVSGYMQSIASTVRRGFADAASGMLAGVSKMAAGQATLGGVMNGVMQTLAGVAMRVGKIIMMSGLAMEKLRQALMSPFSGAPIAAVAAGAALVAIGGAAKAALSSAASGGGGAASGGGPSRRFGGYQPRGQQGGSAIGRDLSAMQAEQRKTREQLAANQEQTNERLAAVEEATRASKNTSEADVRQQEYRAARARQRTDPRT